MFSLTPGVGEFVAFLTAFYIFRLFFVVFFSKEKSDHAEHAHESGPIITLPLVILAVFALIGGLIGIQGIYRYAMPAGRSVASVKAELEGVLATELAIRQVSYLRSDGSTWTLAIKDVTDRAVALEMASNPNACVELRWGAPDKSDEAATCKRHAPAAQRAKMTDYRSWFRERHWPTHTGA